MIRIINFKKIITCPLDMSLGTGLLRFARNDESGDVRGVMKWGTYPSQGRHCEQSEAIQCKQLKPEGLVVPVLSSICIHSLVASCFIPSFQKPCLQMGVPVEVVWEASQAKPSLSPSFTKVKEEKTVARSNYSTQPCKKIIYSSPVAQDFSSGSDHLEKGVQQQRLSKMASSLSTQRQAYHPLPKYPWISRKRRQEGVVALTIKTNGEGQVIEVNLHKSSGHTPLDESALKTVKTWIFTEGNVQKILSIAFLLKNLEGKLKERV